MFVPVAEDESTAGRRTTATTTVSSTRVRFLTHHLHRFLYVVFVVVAFDKKLLMLVRAHALYWPCSNSRPPKQQRVCVDHLLSSSHFCGVKEVGGGALGEELHFWAVVAFSMPVILHFFLIFFFRAAWAPFLSRRQNALAFWLCFFLFFCCSGLQCFLHLRLQNAAMNNTRGSYRCQFGISSSLLHLLIPSAPFGDC